jgi:hypothetical protein
MYTYGITGTSLDEFRDTTIVGVTNGQVLKYNSTTSQWENVDPSTLNIALDNLSDVTLTSPEEFQVLEFDGTSWINKHASVTTYVRNADSVTLGTGTAVYLFGATGDHASVKRADNDSDATSSKTVGLVAAPIDPNENGTVVTRGYVDGIDLSVGYAPGDILWLGEDGGFTKVKPTAPEHLVFIGVVVRATNNGIVYVAVQNGYELDELHDVAISSPARGDVLAWDADSSLWVNEPATVASESLQTPVDARRYAQLGGLLGPVVGANIGGAQFIVFRSACEVDELSVYLTATYSGASTYDYRLGAYRDNNGVPGALIVDAGTVSISTGATMGYKTISLGTPFSVAAGERIWFLVAATHFGSVPNVNHVLGHMQPYSDYGIAGALQGSACAFAYATGPATALPDPFVLGSPQETQTAAVAVYAKVNIP